MTTINMEGGEESINFMATDNSPYEFLLDWLEPFQSIAYSVGLLSIR